jgi:hypothetical protein
MHEQIQTTVQSALNRGNNISMSLALSAASTCADYQMDVASRKYGNEFRLTQASSGVINT